MAARLSWPRIKANLVQGLKTCYGAPFISTAAFLPWEWYRQVVTGKSLIELYFPEQTRKGAEDSWITTSNEYIKRKPEFLVDVYRKIQEFTGEEDEFGTVQHSQQ